MFAVVDSHACLKPFRHMLALFGTYKPARSHNTMDFFKIGMAWYVQKFFFANIFASGLTSLVESGIYGWWYENGNIQKPLLEYYGSFKKIYKKQNKVIGSEFEPTSLEQVSAPINLWLGMLLGALTIFMYEMKCALKVLVFSASNRVSPFVLRMLNRTTLFGFGKNTRK